MKRLLSVFVLTLVSINTNAALDISSTPLLLANNVKPNIMLILDSSGSMGAVLPDAPYDADVTYLSSCPSSRRVNSNKIVKLKMSSGSPEITATGGGGGGWGSSRSWGVDNGQYCFSNEDQYAAYLMELGTWAYYSGNFLNWYFNPNNTTPTWTSNQVIKPGLSTRLQVAKDSAKGVIDDLEDVRMGLASYNSDTGGELNIEVDDLTTTHKNSLTTAIDALNASGTTPLAETLQDVGRYFTTGYNGNLTIHKGGGDEEIVPADTLFNGHSILNDTGVSNLSSPVQYACQKSFSLLLTDGQPTYDQDISSYLSDYDGDCSGSLASGCGSHDKKNSLNYQSSSGSDYLDDVAQALFEMDLRPDLIGVDDDEINNMVTHTIGFADPALLEHPLLDQAAAQAGGNFYTAESTQELIDALRAAIQSIGARETSTAAIVSNSTRLTADSEIYQASFNSGDWSGDLVAYGIAGGDIGTQVWAAAENLPAADDRNLFTWSGGAGIEFLYGELTTTMQTAILSDDHVDYLRGNQSLEVANGGAFRDRSTPLGDIINSDAHYVGDQNFGYVTLGGDAGADYPAYLLSKASNDGVVYVGANDGMLHGFNAEDGSETFAYIPKYAIMQRALADLASTSYRHKYFVDGSAVSGDAWIDRGAGDEWGTYLAGSLGAGGKSVFALDITSPSEFDEGDVLWEFSNTDLGYTFGDPAIVQMETGDWAVVFSNGYDSSNNKAMLFIVDLATGALLSKIDTGVGSVTTPNGLSSASLLDANGNGRIDTAYAGDLLGNLWKFDLSNEDFPTSWGVAYGGATPAPLFSAVNADSQIQPITSPPEISEAPTGQSGVMVTFGTGSYFRDSDQTNSDVQSIYGLLDKGSIIASRTSLVEQEILAEIASGGSQVRVTSDNTVNWNTYSGWFMDLTSGERIVAEPLLRHGRVILTTMTPNSSACEFGGESWLMELDTETGGRLSYSSIDLDGDLAFDENDYVEVTIDGATIDVPVSGVKYDSGIVKVPYIIADGDKEYKLGAGSSGEISRIVEKGAVLQPRSSWRELTTDW